MSCYRFIVDDIEFDVFAANLRRALFEVALRFGCHYGDLGMHYFENGERCDYRFNDLVYYDYVVSHLEQ